MWPFNHTARSGSRVPRGDESVMARHGSTAPTSPHARMGGLLTRRRAAASRQLDLAVDTRERGPEPLGLRQRLVVLGLGGAVAGDTAAGAPVERVPGGGRGADGDVPVGVAVPA